MIVEARIAIEKIPGYFEKRYNATFYFDTAITAIEHPKVFAGKQHWSADGNIRVQWR